MPVWSVVVVQCGLNWLAVNNIYEGPIYMKHVIKFKTVKVIRVYISVEFQRSVN